MIGEHTVVIPADLRGALRDQLYGYVLAVAGDTLNCTGHKLCHGDYSDLESVAEAFGRIDIARTVLRAIGLRPEHDDEPATVKLSADAAEWLTSHLREDGEYVIGEVLVDPSAWTDPQGSLAAARMHLEIADVLATVTAR